MSKIFISENGQIRDFSDAELVDSVIKARNTKGPWEVIDLLVHLWARKAPDEVEAMQININQYRETQTDKEFGQTLGGKDQERRFTLSFPKKLMLMIRTQYKADELPFDSAFYKEFAKRYPAFKVAEKV